MPAEGYVRIGLGRLRQACQRISWRHAAWHEPPALLTWMRAPAAQAFHGPLLSTEAGGTCQSAPGHAGESGEPATRRRLRTLPFSQITSTAGVHSWAASGSWRCSKLLAQGFGWTGRWAAYVAGLRAWHSWTRSRDRATRSANRHRGKPSRSSATGGFSAARFPATDGRQYMTGYKLGPLAGRDRAAASACRAAGARVA